MFFWSKNQECGRLFLRDLDSPAHAPDAGKTISVRDTYLPWHRRCAGEAKDKISLIIFSSLWLEGSKLVSKHIWQWFDFCSVIVWDPRQKHVHYYFKSIPPRTHTHAHPHTQTLWHLLYCGSHTVSIDLQYWIRKLTTQDQDKLTSKTITLCWIYGQNICAFSCI